MVRTDLQTFVVFIYKTSADNENRICLTEKENVSESKSTMGVTEADVLAEFELNPEEDRPLALLIDAIGSLDAATGDYKLTDALERMILRTWEEAQKQNK
jgi:hypothetical protein